MNFKIDNLEKVNSIDSTPSLNLLKKISLFVGVFIVVFLFLARIVYLQIFQYSHYSAEAQKNYVKKTSIFPPRGLIYSSDDKVLVENTPYFALGIDLTTMNKFKEYSDLNEILTPDEVKFLKESKTALSEDFISELNDSLRFGKNYYILDKFFDKEKYISIKTKLSELHQENNLTRLNVYSESYRNYLEPQIYSHLLGYTSFVDENAVAQDSWYTPNAVIGRTGLELEYEKYLRGEKGIEETIYNSKSMIVSNKVIQEPKPGYSLYTSINTDIQNVAYSSLQNEIDKVDAMGGAVVVQDPNTGEVIAMVSLPSYDNNLFSTGISTSEYSNYINDSNKPLTNRVISMAFPPASTFKAIMSIAAIQEKSLAKDTLFNDNGVISIGPYTYKTWKAGGHGVIDIVGALKQSSDTFYYVLGGGHNDYPDIKALGPWKIYNYSRAFGFGQLLKIDLPEEHPGFVPNPDWKKSTLGEDWYIGNTYHFSIGQGFLTTTPLQVNTMINAIANGGKVLQPHIVKKIVSSDKKETIEIKPNEITNLNLSKEALEVVKEGLVEAVKPGGTAYPLFNYPVVVAGKTGTAEYGVADENGNLPTHAWFTAFAPADNPEISVTVFVENGGGGSDVAAPVAKEIFDEYFKIESTKTTIIPTPEISE